MKKFLFILTTIILTLSLCSCSFGDKVSIVLSKFIPAIAEEQISEFCENLTPPYRTYAKSSFDIRENTLICRFDYTRNLLKAEIEKIKNDANKLPASLFEMMISLQKECPAIENFVYEYYDISGVLFHSVEASEDEYVTACESVKELAATMSTKDDGSFIIIPEACGTAIKFKTTLPDEKNPTAERIQQLEAETRSSLLPLFAKEYLFSRLENPALRAYVIEYYDADANPLFNFKIGADEPDQLIQAYAKLLNENNDQKNKTYYNSGRALHCSYLSTSKGFDGYLLSADISKDMDTYIKESEEILLDAQKFCPEIESYVSEFTCTTGEIAFSFPAGFSIWHNNEAVEKYASSISQAVAQNSSNDTMSCCLGWFKNSLVYEYKYRDLTDATPKQKETLRKELENNRASLEAAVDIIKSECPQVDSVFYTYYETDGDVIATIEVE